MLAVDVPQAAKSGYLNGHTQFHQWDPTSLVLRINFLQATISWHRSRVFNTEPCGERPQDSEAWHDIKWFRKFDGRSLGYVKVPKAMVSKFKLFKLAHSDFALVVVMLVLVATVAIPVVVPMAMVVPAVMLMMPTIMVPMSIPALDTMHYAAGDSLAWIPLRQGRCASRQYESGGSGK
jgi:hypothetical protein